MLLEVISRQRSELLLSKEEAAQELSLLEPGERIVSTYKCSRITPFTIREGELVMCEGHLYFIEDPRPKKKVGFPKNVVMATEDIREIHKRRYLLKSNAMELFLTTGKTYLLAFETEKERNAVYDHLMSLSLPNRVNYEAENIKSITKKWKNGLIRQDPTNNFSS